MVITIDGLSTNGKTTIAMMLAKKYNFTKFNTGLIYRIVAYKIIKDKLDITNEDEVINALSNWNVTFESERAFLDGEDITEKLYTEKVDYYSTKWGSLIFIKEFVCKVQRDAIHCGSVIMEGRDIGTRIAPHAELKFYLYSDFEVRVSRLAKKMERPLEEVRDHLKGIDNMDINMGNFIYPEGAIEIDVTNRTLEEVVSLMSKEIDRVLANKLANPKKELR